MLNTNMYDYMKVLDKAADAAWIRNDCIQNNLANVNTPGYKREDVDFTAQLKQAMSQFHYMTTDEKVANLTSRDLAPKSYIDYGGYSYRKDENNVDIDVENVYLAENQIYYNGLVMAITTDFNDLRTVTK
ncbi:MAG: flagellar basal body rod protein FlgB [Lachnospiraceae bacterium]|nr:flagellar basal body rod protein FlgB [Lachnospiraceae bacterium]